MTPPSIPYPVLQETEFRADNAARILGYSWADVQDFHTLRVKTGVRILCICRSTGLPFTPPGDWIAVMVDVPEYGPIWFHQSATVVAYMAEQSSPATGFIDRPAAFLVA